MNYYKQVPPRYSKSIHCVKNVKIAKDELFNDGLVRNKQDAKKPKHKHS